MVPSIISSLVIPKNNIFMNSFWGLTFLKIIWSHPSYVSLDNICPSEVRLKSLPVTWRGNAEKTGLFLDSRGIPTWESHFKLGLASHFIRVHVQISTLLITQLTRNKCCTLIQNTPATSQILDKHCSSYVWKSFTFWNIYLLY